MAYRLRPGRPVGADLVRVVREQIDRAMDAAIDRKRSAAERVHTARTSCKKIRAVLRLARPQQPALYARENAWFRDSARELSRLRDATVLLSAWDALVRHFSGEMDRRRTASIRRQLVQHRRQTASNSAVIDQALRRFVTRMHEARERLADGPDDDGEDFEEIAPGVHQTYRRARKTMQRAYVTAKAQDFHAWRKAVKIHGYHCRLLRNAWPPLMKKWHEQLASLGELLGSEHDLAVLRAHLRNIYPSKRRSKTIRAVLDVIERQRDELRAQAKLLGRRLLAEKTSAMVRRIAHWWRTAAKGA